MATTRISVRRFQGVYYRVSKFRPWFDGKPDQCFDISYKSLNGRKIWEKIGWKSEGISAAYAAQIRAERVRNLRLGDENITVQEKKKRAATLSEAAQNYFKWTRNNTKGAAIEVNRYNKHIEPTLGNKTLYEITSDDLETFKEQLRSKKLQPKSIHLILSLIRAIYNRATLADKYDGPVPTRKRGIFPKFNNKRLRFLSHEEAVLLLDALQARSPQLHDEALVALHGGLRFGEIATLTWHDLNFRTEVIQIRSPKNNVSRVAYMTPQVKQMLKKRRSDWESKETPDEGAIGDNIFRHLVFPDNKGGKQKGVSKTFERVINDLGFNAGLDKQDAAHKVVFHSLRHSFASWLALQGTPLYTIKELMGHKSIAMTERYSHLIPDHHKVAITTMAKAFSEVEEKPNT